MNNKISVIVPVYNTKVEYLEKCVNSLIHQTYSDLEVLIIDDGSKEEVALACDHLAKRDSRIKVFHKSNGGVSSARNLGLEKCSGEYVAFVDSDDWVEQDFLRLLLKGFEESNVGMSICNISYDEDHENLQTDECSEQCLKEEDIQALHINKEEIYSHLLYSTKIGGFLCNKLFKKELITQGLDINLHYSEDFVFCLKYVEQINRAVFFEKVVYHYRQNCGNASQNLSYNSRIFTLLNAYEKIREIYCENAPSEVPAVEKNILKIALNIRARYKINKSKNVQEYQVITNTIRKYFSCIMKNKKVNVATKVNIIITYLFPTLALRIKSRILGRRL